MTAARPAGYIIEAHDTGGSRVAQTHEKYERLIARAKAIPAIRTAVVWPCEEHALAGPVEAAEIIAPILVGSEERIRTVAQKAGLDVSGCEFEDVETEEAAAAAAVHLVRERKAQSLMKGSLHTELLMHEVVAKDSGLRTGRRISHVFLIDVPTYPDVLFITDAAINIFPDVETKRDIIQNAIELHRHAQILVVPDLEAGNMLAKNLVFLAQADAAGIVLGAAVPIILTSRADSVRTRTASTAIGALYAHYLAEQRFAGESHT